VCEQVRLEEDELTQLLSMHEHVQHFDAILGKTVCTSSRCTSNVCVTLLCDTALQALVYVE